MSAYTAGPWDCGYQNATFGEYAVGTGLRCVATVHASGPGDPEALANCNLVRAAPELLDALERVLEDGHDDFGFGKHAVAKARGATA